jgi:hypothetical protein
MTKHHHAVRLCWSHESVSSLLAHDPNLAPGDAWEKLYGDRALKSAAKSDSEGIKSDSVVQSELEIAANCGKWGPTKPSELFLRVCMLQLVYLGEQG